MPIIKARLFTALFQYLTLLLKYFERIHNDKYIFADETYAGRGERRYRIRYFTGVSN